MAAKAQRAAARETGQLDPGRADAAARRRLSGPGLRSFLQIADAWGLSEAQRLRLLGNPARSTYHAWVQKARRGAMPALSLDTLTRISALLGIYKALRIVFRTDAEGLAWLRTANAGPLFGGQRPLDLITGGPLDGLLQVRRHLDAWRGGRFTAPIPGHAIERAPIGEDEIALV